jgi:hypothetical protein
MAHCTRSNGSRLSASQACDAIDEHMAHLDKFAAAQQAALRKQSAEVANTAVQLHQRFSYWTSCLQKLLAITESMAVRVEQHCIKAIRAGREGGMHVDLASNASRRPSSAAHMTVQTPMNRASDFSGMHQRPCWLQRTDGNVKSGPGVSEQAASTAQAATLQLELIQARQQAASAERACCDLRIVQARTDIFHVERCLLVKLCWQQSAHLRIRRSVHQRVRPCNIVSSAKLVITHVLAISCDLCAKQR